MKLIRTVVALVGIGLMSVGYFVSQVRFFQGATADYVARLDESSVPLLSLALLLAAVVLGFVDERPEKEDEGAEG